MGTLDEFHKNEYAKMNPAQKDAYFNSVKEDIKASKLPAFYGENLLSRMGFHTVPSITVAPKKAVVDYMEKIPSYHVDTKDFNSSDKKLLKDLQSKFIDLRHEPMDAIKHVKEYKLLDEMGKAAHDTFIKEWHDTPEALLKTARML